MTPISSPRVVFLGPQRRQPTVRDALLSMPGYESGAPIAAVTAGWEGRELEHDELEAHVEGRVVNLEVYRRVEDIYLRDPELREAVRARHDRLRRLQDLYRIRLAHLVDAAREVQVYEDDDPQLVESEFVATLQAIRALDERHLEQIRSMHAEFRETWQQNAREHVARHREEIRGLLADCPALCIAGGHVTVLLNRLRVVDILPLHGDRPIVAWSAGAMALSGRVVLFHDSPPQGPGAAELFETGLRAVRGIVPLPHASDRLDLADQVRIRILAGRFDPLVCVALNPGSRVDWDGVRWRSPAATQRLSTEGTLQEVGA